MNIYQKICFGFLVILIVFWSYLYFNGITEGFYNYLYSFLFGLIPLIGGGIAMIKSKIWGGMGSAVGKAVFFIGLGLVSWGIGEAIWSYYNFVVGIPAPYPSFADIGFAPSIFFYGWGAIYLSKATGAKYGLRNPFAKVLVVLATLATLVFSYYMTVEVARGGVIIPEGEPLLKSILDIAYPFGDIVALTISVIISGLSFKYFGGRYVLDIVSILLGLGVMFVGDTIFSYTTTVGTYYNGNIGDLVLTLGLFFLTYGILGFCSQFQAKTS